MPVTWSQHDAVLFDLDGVLTPTAEVHMRAWAEMFDAFLAGFDDPGADTSPYSDADYFAHVDGKPRGLGGHQRAGLAQHAVDGGLQEQERADHGRHRIARQAND